MSRSLRLVLGCAALALATGPIAPSLAQSGTVTADKEGWWSRTGRVAPTALPTTVPEDAIAVGAFGGEAYAVAALGVVLDAARGSTVQTFTLSLVEAEGTGANQNAASAAIVACPIVDFFAGDHAGAWEDAPAADCDAASAEGKRGDDGTWTFDLTAIADVWLDPFGTLAANGLRFEPVGGSFQVSWTGMEDATFDVAITPPEDDGDPFDSATTTVPGGFTGTDSAPPARGGVDPGPPPAIDAPTTTATTVGVPTTVDEQVATDEAAVSRAGDVAGNLPATVIVLIVVAAAGAVAVALALGPLGRARPAVARRSGGVSRALEARTGAP